MLHYFFSIPFLRSTLTRNGVAPKVMEIRTGANTLWTEYAMTNVLAPVPILLASTESPRFRYSIIAATSRPLLHVATKKTRRQRV